MIERVEVDEKSLAALVTALRAESDGRELMRDLTVKFAAIGEKAAAEARAMILSMPSPMAVTRGPGLRISIANKVVVRVRINAQSKRPGVVIRALKTGMPRGFINAPKRTNARRGWRHKVFGRDVWEHQMGMPGWFDDTMARHRPAMRRAAQRAMNNIARRIDARTRG